jgi:hypothetical protein
MRTQLFWINGPWPGRLAILPRPRGGDWLEDEIRSWRDSGLDLIVSLLTPDERTELDVSQEEALCRANGIEYLAFPIVDRAVPSSKEAFLELITTCADHLAIGKNIAVHCRLGIGRAALVAICLLIFAGVAEEIAAARVSSARGCSVPETVDQRRWIADFARSQFVQLRQ